MKRWSVPRKLSLGMLRHLRRVAIRFLLTTSYPSYAQSRYDSGCLHGLP